MLRIRFARFSTGELGGDIVPGRATLASMLSIRFVRFSMGQYGGIVVASFARRRTLCMVGKCFRTCFGVQVRWDVFDRGVVGDLLKSV
jgi:hypothetical protein